MRIDNILGQSPELYMRLHGGIYVILNTVTDWAYIGQAKCFAQRYTHHIYLLRKNKHANRKLQAAWNKHGEQAFVFEMPVAFRTRDIQAGIVIDLGPIEWDVMKGYANSYNLVFPSYRMKGKIVA